MRGGTIFRVPTCEKHDDMLMSSQETRYSVRWQFDIDAYQGSEQQNVGLTCKKPDFMRGLRTMVKSRLGSGTAYTDLSRDAALLANKIAWVTRCCTFCCTARASKAIDPIERTNPTSSYRIWGDPELDFHDNCLWIAVWRIL
jgi:hypothetical protein